MASAAIQAPPPTKHELLGDMRAIIETVDTHARELNRRWGHNRLPHLVPIELTEKFRTQKQLWETACFECAGSLDPDHLERVRKHGNGMLRAYSALERVATEDGALPAPPDVWEFELKDGTTVVLVRSRAELAQVEPNGRTVQIWSLEEIADVIAKFPGVCSAKEAFPGAEVIQLRTNPVVIDKLDDELADIPF